VEIGWEMLLDYWTLSNGNGQIASAIQQLGFTKLNSQIENC